MDFNCTNYYPNRISSSDIAAKQDDFYIDDDIPDDNRNKFTNGSIVEMLENLSTDDENELRVSFVENTNEPKISPNLNL